MKFKNANRKREGKRAKEGREGIGKEEKRKQGREVKERRGEEGKINTTVTGNEFSVKRAIMKRGNLICCNKHQGKRPR